MLKDRIITGAIIGVLADLVKLATNYILYLFKLTDVVFWQLTATRFLERNDLFNPIVYLVGGIADLTITAVLGVVFVLFIYFFGKDYIWLKGIGFALFA